MNPVDYPGDNYYKTCPNDWSEAKRLLWESDELSLVEKALFQCLQIVMCGNFGERPAPSKELMARWLGVQRSAIARAWKNLEDGGWLIRRPDGGWDMDVKLPPECLTDGSFAPEWGHKR